MQKVRWPYPLGRPFFGLGPEHRELILEEAFVLSQRMNMSYDVFVKMPVLYRRWFIKRIIKQNNPAPDNAMDDMNTPITKSMRLNT